MSYRLTTCVHRKLIERQNRTINVHSENILLTIRYVPPSDRLTDPYNDKICNGMKLKLYDGQRCMPF